MDVQRWLSSGVGAVADWEAGFVAFRPDPSAAVTDERFAAAFEAFTQRLRDNYPYFHPSYAGQMLKPPHPAAVVGYLTAMLINPNNHPLASRRATDSMHEVLAVARRHGVRVHVDAAYGGFFTLLAGLEDPAGLARAPWQAIAGCDSVVVDPHKHGLQPYGCGAVLFRDPDVARLYLHDSPYTYFTSDEPHLGEISLECSRSGAAAPPLSLTFPVLPPTPPALPPVLAAGRRAALTSARLIEASGPLDLYQPPELDIVSYFPVITPPSLAA